MVFFGQKKASGHYFSDIKRWNMRLEQVLGCFGSPREAAEICGLSRTAGYHWYASGVKRVIPPMEVLVGWADHLGLSDSDLGLLVRDCCLLRSIRLRGGGRKRVQRSKSVPSVDWQKKEQYLESLETDEKSAIEEDVFVRMRNLLERHIK
jgi:hypothetical protein